MSFIENIFIFQEKIWDFVLYFSYFLYFLFVIGFANNAPEYLIPLNYYVQIYVSLFLIIRFNPFSNIKFTELDKKIAFTGGVFIISTTILNKSMLDYVSELKSLIHNKI
uniref:Uncharacterized protein n=1 Tax=viral metagenome TaxID=1070528 RepID=A0A6C0IEX5_9ZZZZ